MRVKPALLVLIAGLATAGLASAQTPQDPEDPTADRRDLSARGPSHWAVGGDFGFQNTTGDDDFDTEPLLGAYGEFFQTNRLSWRGMVQVVELEHSMPRPAPGGGDSEILIIGGNALYNWQNPQASPFVTGGLGFYRYDLGPDRGEDTEGGMNLGGGVNLHMTPAVSFKLETLVHVTAQEDGPDSFVIGTGGIKYGW